MAPQSGEYNNVCIDEYKVQCNSVGMAQTVRIDEATHGLLRELAKADGVSLHEELARAVEARRRECFFAALRAGYAALSPKDRAEEATEHALWDRSLSDGLNDE